MNSKEQRIREAARFHFDCMQRTAAAKAQSVPADPDEARAAFENLQVLQAEEMRSYYALISAKSEFSK